MGNPARELAEKLERWMVLPPKNSLKKVRGIHREGTVDQWREVISAAHLLDEVDQYLLGMEAAGIPVAHYQRAYPRWAAAVVAPDTQWGSVSQSSDETVVIDRALVDQMHALADVMDATTPMLRLTTETRTASISAIDDVLSLLRDPAVQLTEVQRRYVFELVAEVRRMFDEAETLGGVDLLRRVHELIGVLSMIAEGLAEDPETMDLAARLRDASSRVAPYMKFGVIAAAGAIDVAANLLAITAFMN